MKQFDHVVNALRDWLTSIPWIRAIMPFAQQILIASLAASAVYELMMFSFVRIARHFSILSTLGHYGFLLGFWLILISYNNKWAPYALFAKAFLVLFPFSYLSLSTIMSVGVYVYLGYWLLKYTAYTAVNR